MTIEIRQISIRSTVVDNRERQDAVGSEPSDLSSFKGEMMDACRQLVEEMLLDREER